MNTEEIIKKDEETVEPRTDTPDCGCDEHCTEECECECHQDSGEDGEGRPNHGIAPGTIKP